jgi:cytochrome c-type biogenesis protein CcmH/NrfG
MLEAIHNILQRPAATEWLLLVIAVAAVIIAVCSVLILGILRVAGAQLVQRASFSENMQPLLDRGDLDTLIEKCRDRLKQFNDDASAHYFLGVALHRRGDLRQALTHLKRISQLQAGWDVQPMIQAIEDKIAASDEKPGLKVVKTTDDRPDPA